MSATQRRVLREAREDTEQQVLTGGAITSETAIINKSSLQRGEVFLSAPNKTNSSGN